MQLMSKSPNPFERRPSACAVGNLPWLLPSRMWNVTNSKGGCETEICGQAWCAGLGPCCWSPVVRACRRLQESLALPERWFDSGSLDSSRNGSTVLATKAGADASPLFPPEIAIHVVKLACELPRDVGRSLSQWDCTELACQLEEEGLVESISRETVSRILESHRLKPWRVHMWLGEKTPRDEAFLATVQEICDLYTEELPENEIVLSLDEKTSLQPRTRKQPTLPAQPGKPVLVEHEYSRQGALNLFAAFDTRSGQVYGQCYGRKRQLELIVFLGHLDSTIPEKITRIHIVCDNLRTYTGKQVRAWLESHPRFVFHFTPVHCSWMNQVEQWFSILQRKRLRIADFASKEDLRDWLYAYIAKWNQHAHPFNWTSKSVAKVMAYSEPQELVV